MVERMRALFRILLIATVIVFIVYFTSDSIEESKPLEGPNASSKVIPKTKPSVMQNNSILRPTEGMSTWIGKESSKFEKKFGSPSLKEPSAFGYEWWVYNGSSPTFMMIGVEDDIITQVYIAGKDLDATPFTIGQTLDDIYRSTILDSEVSVTIDDNIYTFSISERDMTTRLLVQFEGVYGQLYMDEERGTLQAVRFTDGETLVLHQPYEMSFVGELITYTPPSSYLQETINEANEQTLVNIVNLIRENNDLPILTNDEQLSNIAHKHSEEMLSENFFSHDSPTSGSLKERLTADGIVYKAAAENIASDYYDGIEAAHGLLNSEDHRSVLLDEKFTNVGSGVFLNYYTQIFIEKDEDNKSENQQQNENGRSN